MKISVFGVGYVGLVTGACLAELGNQVLCCDTNPEKIQSLKKLKSPFYERGLEEIIERNGRAGRLEFFRHRDKRIAAQRKLGRFFLQLSKTLTARRGVIQGHGNRRRQSNRLNRPFHTILRAHHSDHQDNHKRGSNDNLCFIFLSHLIQSNEPL